MASETNVVEADALGDEIAELEEQIAATKKQLKIQASTIIASIPSQSLVKESSRSRSKNNKKLLKGLQGQETHQQQCLHRICNPVTAFKVHDPDPNAVDDGHVLGLRFEVMSRSQFLKPYYVMLNRPYSKFSALRVHRHTLPSAIPLAGLAARHLPAPKPEDGNPPLQDLDQFVRTLRREIIRYHNRLGISADLRRALGLHQVTEEDTEPTSIVEVGIADIEAKQIKLTWADERHGRLVMDDDGKVTKFSVFGVDGRDWETTKSLFDRPQRIEEVVEKLKQSSTS
ncbi:unnamed protein product [Clonostachys rosea]|uniref:Cenp-O kinetochore centromere component n=1 Tax=Bionectria ochroleuca TaxID=29856 RepID=A0ABY6UPE3_BIOOC|nr:unnamed protein product [Clonostachys rosea]